ncbi:MAG: hypothetical protein ACFB9N_09640 [Geitlerinemataceae cyanobacterium]
MSSQDITTLTTPEEANEKTHEERVGEKRLLVYLIESGLIDRAQLPVLEYDRQMTGKAFSEILIDRGWVRRKTLDFLVERVIVPEQRAKRKRTNSSQQRMQPISALGKEYLEQQRRESQEEVNWTID